MCKLFLRLETDFFKAAIIHLFVLIAITSSLGEGAPTDQLLATIRIGAWANESQYIQIGAILTLKNDASPEAECGQALFRSYMLFVTFVNELFGGLLVDGQRRFLSVLIIEDRATEATVKEATRRLIEDYGIKFIISPCFDELTEYAASTIDLLGGVQTALMVSPTAVRPQTFADRPFLFFTTTAYHDLTKPAFRYFANNGLNTVAYFLESSRFADEVCAGVATFIEDYNMSLAYRFDLTNRTNLTEEVRLLKLARPDFVIACTSTSLCENYILEARRQNFQPKAHLDLACVTPTHLDSLYQKTGDPLVGRWFLGAGPRSIWSPSVNHASTLFPGMDTQYYDYLFRIKYGSSVQVSVFDAAGFGTLEIFLFAIRHCRCTNPQEVADTLNDLKLGDLTTMFGEIEFNNLGENIMTYTILQYQGGSDAAIVVLGGKDNGTTPFMPIPAWTDYKCYENINASVYGYDESGQCGRCPNNTMATYSMSSQRRTCNDCEQGMASMHPIIKESSWDDNFDYQECFPMCPFGSVPDFNYAFNRMECDRCKAGTYVDPDFARCRPCPPGSWSDVGQPACDMCPVGHFAASEGTSECTKCPLGKAIYLEGRIACEDCGLGRYAGSSGSERCTICPPGSVASASGLSACETCAAGNYSLWGSIACGPCPPGSFQHELGRSMCSDCSLLVGATCDGIGLAIPLNKVGYWMPSPLTLTLHPEKCQYNFDACLDKERCSPGHMGRQCASCKPGWSKHSDGSCYICPPLAWNIIATLIVMVIIASLTMFLAHMVAASTGRPRDIGFVLMKQLLNHCIVMSVCYVLFMDVLRDTVAQLDMNAQEIRAATLVISWFQIFDGTPPSESEVWSMSCLVQPVITATDAALISSLSQLKHSMFHSPEYQVARDAYTSQQTLGELGRMLLWTFWPLIITLIACGFGYFKLFRYVRSRIGDYGGAMQFYEEVYRDGFEATREKYIPRIWWSFVQSYYYKIYDIWWPIAHMGKCLVCGRPCTLTFLEESYTLGFAVVLFAFGSSVRGIMRPMKCVPMVRTEPILWMLARMEVRCNENVALFRAGLIISCLWCIGWPLFTCLRIRRAKKQLPQSEIIQKYGLLLLGYRRKRWWWEFVVFIRKGSCFFVEVIPGKGELRGMVFLCCALFFSVLHVVFDPYEKRNGGISERLERLHIAIWVACCIGLNACITWTSHRVIFFVPLLLVIVHLSYIFLVLYHLLTQLLMDIEKSLNHNQRERSPRWLDFWKNILIHRHARILQSLPYVSMDPYYGWVSVCGNRGDLCEPPYIPKGNAKQDLLVPLRLSNAPQLPHELSHEKESHLASVQPVSKICEKDLHESLAQTTQHVLFGAGPAFSPSALEFVIRAALLFCYEDNDQMNADVEDIDPVLWRNAVAEKDPLTLVGIGDAEHPIGGRQELDENNYMRLKLARRLEGDLIATRVAVLRGRQARKVAERLKEHADRVLEAEGDFVRSAGAAGGLVISRTTAVTTGVFTVTTGATVGAVASLVGRNQLGRSALARIDLLRAGTNAQFSVLRNNILVAGDFAGAAADAAAHGVQEVATGITSSLGAALGSQGLDGQQGEMNESLAMECGEMIDLQGASKKGSADEIRRFEDEHTKKFRARYSLLVDKMFKPSIFRKGVRVTDLESALFRLHGIETEDLRVWLTIFEERWIQQRAQAHEELQRSDGTKKDDGEQVDIDQEQVEARQRARVMRPVPYKNFCSQTDFAEGNANLGFHEQEEIVSTLEVSVPALQWYRMYIMVAVKSSGAASMFKLGALKRTMQLRSGTGAAARRIVELNKYAERLRRLEVSLREVDAELQAYEEVCGEEYDQPALASGFEALQFDDGVAFDLDEVSSLIERGLSGSSDAPLGTRAVAQLQLPLAEVSSTKREVPSAEPSTLYPSPGRTVFRDTCTPRIHRVCG